MGCLFCLKDIVKGEILRRFLFSKENGYANHPPLHDVGSRHGFPSYGKRGRDRQPKSYVEYSLLTKGYRRGSDPATGERDAGG